MAGFCFAFLAALSPGLGAAADDLNGLRNSVGPVGDVDGDGVPDFALALRSDAGESFSDKVGKPRTDLGRVLVVSGASGERIRFLTPPAPRDHEFGRVLEDLGDVDGDGFRDLAVAGSERVWVFSGADGSVLYDLGRKEYGPRFGRAIAGGGDLDGDGLPDLVVAGAERLFAFSGRDGALLRALGCGPRPEWLAQEQYVRIAGHSLENAVGLLPGRGAEGRAGIALVVGEDRLRSALELCVQGGPELQRIPLPPPMRGGPWVVRSLPDVDGDAVPEIVITLVHDHVLVYSGATGVELQRHSWLDGYMHAEGTSLEVVGDLDLDGFADYLVAANEDSIDCDPGMAVIFSGKDGSALRRFSIDGYPLRGRCGVGVDACGLGDANADGIPDVLVHLPRLREARVLSGADFSVLLTVDLAPDSPVLSPALPAEER